MCVCVCVCGGLFVLWALVFMLSDGNFIRVLSNGACVV